MCASQQQTDYHSWNPETYGLCTAAGNCQVEVAKYCASTSAGEGRLADCVSDQIAESEVVTDGKGKRPPGDRDGGIIRNAANAVRGFRVSLSARESRPWTGCILNPNIAL